MELENLFYIVAIFIATILLFYCVEGSKSTSENYDIVDIPTGCIATAGGDIMMCPCGGRCPNGSRCRAMPGCKC